MFESKQPIKEPGFFSSLLMPFHKLAPAELVLDRKDYRQFVQWMYVSCWHGQAHESFDIRQIREAILMQTTSDKLKDAFDRQYPNVLPYFDQVDYKDPAQAEQIAFPKIQRLSTRPADVPGGEWFLYMVFLYIKHITYQYEHEVRLVSLHAGYVNGGSNSKKGITLDILAVPHFIERVSVAPGVDEWFYQTVKETVARFGITCEVSRSTLEAPGEAS